MPDNSTIDPKDPRKALRALTATALFLILIFVLAHFGEFLGLRDGEPGITTDGGGSVKAGEAVCPAPAGRPRSRKPGFPAVPSFWSGSSMRRASLSRTPNWAWRSAASCVQRSP
jgi:hypothetical protein